MMWLLVGCTALMWIIAVVAALACVKAASRPYPPMG